MTTAFTIIGAAGTVGSHLRRRLEAQGDVVFAPDRGDVTWLHDGRALGHVLYCAGLTTDALDRPFDTIRAHVGLLGDVLDRARFDSLLYLSSTRVYAKAASGVETSPLVLDPSDPEDFFAITKIAGEAICARSGRDGVRVVRLSNVYGADAGAETFLASLVNDAVATGRVRLRTSVDSTKDYVSLEEVGSLLPQIATAGAHALYNIASGRNVTNGAVMDALTQASGCTWVVAADAPTRVFPAIDVSRLRGEFPGEPGSVLDDLPALVAVRRERLTES